MELSEISLSYTGSWWVPEDPNTILPGTLTFSPLEGVRLTLLGNFDKKFAHHPLGTMILGEDSFGTRITVYQSLFQSGSSPAFDPSKGQSTYVANKAFIGCHFPTSDQAIFRTVGYRPTYLDEWLRLPTVKIEDRSKGFRAVYSRPQPLVLSQTEEATISIGFSTAGPDLSPSLNILTFAQHAYFVIRNASPAHFDFYGDAMYHLDNFLALAAMAPVYPIEVDGYLPDTPSPSLPVKILLPLPKHAREGDIRFFQMLFSYSDVSATLGTHIHNWLTKRELLEPVFDLFFASTYNPYSGPVQTFLNYVQALETYHRRTRPNFADPPDLHSGRLDAIKASAPEEYRNWISERLAFSNEPTLAKRLTDLVDANPELVTGMVGDHDSFIRRVKDSRHYYTHYDPAGKERAEHGGKLKGLSMVLGSMLEAFLLLEAGFDPPQVRELQRNRRTLPDAWL